MNFAALILAAERTLAAAEGLRAGYVTEQRGLLEQLPNDRASLSDAQQARFDELSKLKATSAAEIDAARAKVEELKREQDDDARLTASAEQRTAGAERQPLETNSREARTYTSETAQRGVSFFSDTYRARFKSDRQASDRLERHEREVVVEHETRAVGTGGIGGLLVPQYLVDLVALPLRTGRPFAEVVTNLALPAEGMTLVIPRWTSGTTVTSQTAEFVDVANVDIVADTDLTVPVRTIAGEQDVSRQLLDRGTPGIDGIIYADLVGAYHAQVDWQTINGSGTAGQHLGVRNTAGVAGSTGFGVALAGGDGIGRVYAKIAGAIAAVSTGVNQTEFLEANIIVMHPRRWAWIISQVDSEGRPLVNTSNHGPSNVVGLNLNPGKVDSALNGTQGPRVVGEMHGLPVITDANIPTNVGTNLEDVVLVGDKTKVLLWEEGDGAPREVQYDEAAPSKLQVKLQVYGYSAFTAGRRPGALAIIGGQDTVAGNGLVAPTF